MKLIECVPNFSEGRDPCVLQKLQDAFNVPSVKLIHFTADPDHNRSVATVVGEPMAVAAAMLSAVGIAARNINLNRHDGQHPCIGATDVVPLVPLKDVTPQEAVSLAVQLAEGIAVTYEIPTYLYELAARRPQCINLADIRRGGFERLSSRMRTLDFLPDFGPMKPHPTAGATVVGARKFLIAFNVNLDTADVAVAKKIARAVRERDGGLARVKALGVYLDSACIAQVAMNLTDYEMTPPSVAYARVKELAASFGVGVKEGELIGLIPRAAVQNVTGTDLGLSYDLESRIIENLLPPEFLA